MKIRATIIGILSAFYNLLFREEKTSKIALERKEQCDNCIMNSTKLKQMFPRMKVKRKDEHCTLCKCNLFLKQHSSKTKCPNNLWIR